MTTNGAFLLQAASFLSESSWVSWGLMISVIAGTIVITRMLTKIRGDIDNVTTQASEAKKTIEGVALTQKALGEQLLILTQKVTTLLNNHVSRTELRLWILRFKVANPGLNVPDFSDDKEAS